MTQEDKELLLKDLCARLLYWPHVKTVDDDDAYIVGLDDTEKGLFYVHILEDGDSYDTTMSVENFKRYLRSMSSMTEDEKKVYQSLQDTACSYHYEFGYIVEDFLYFDNYASLDYLNSIHVDYRGLIEKGLALEAPDGMYNVK